MIATSVDMPAGGEDRKDAFLRILGHELRNPLGSMRTAVTILRHQGVTGQAQWAVDVIERQLGELVTLVEAMSEVSRLSRGQGGTTAVPFSMNEVVSAAMTASAPVLAAKHQTCDLHLPAHDTNVVGDAARFGQALRVLLRCASKACVMRAALGLRVSVEGGQCTVRICAASAIDAAVTTTPASLFESSIDVMLARSLADALGGSLDIHGLRDDSPCYVLRFPLPPAPPASP
jgi:signal transduction histidine kinase